METVKILSGNRITLPKEFLDFWKLSEGDLVGLIVKDPVKSLSVMPVEVKEKKLK